MFATQVARQERVENRRALLIGLKAKRRNQGELMEFEVKLARGT